MLNGGHDGCLEWPSSLLFRQPSLLTLQLMALSKVSADSGSSHSLCCRVGEAFLNRPSVLLGMESRWLLLGFGLVFVVLILTNVSQGNVLLALIAAVFAIFSLGGFWWNTTQDDPIRTRSFVFS